VTAELVVLLRDREARIDALTGELVARTEAATVWQARAELLAERIAAAESQILALTAPQAPVDVPGSTGPPDPTQEPSTPWWRRWRAWLAAGLVVAVVGSASCGGQTPAVESQTPAGSPIPAAMSLKRPNLCRAGMTLLDQANMRQGNNPSWTTGYEPQTLLSVIDMLEKVC
jgi:hypothetical protein